MGHIHYRSPCELDVTKMLDFWSEGHEFKSQHHQADTNVNKDL